MTFEKWIAEWCDCEEFEGTEEHFHLLVRNNFNMGDDMLRYMEEAFIAGVRSQKGTNPRAAIRESIRKGV